MKKSIVFILFLCAAFAIEISAQVPQGINYQAVARNAIGDVIVDQNVTVKVSILKNNADGQVLYSETHAPKTNKFGLFNLAIGTGNASSGKFANISWNEGNTWVKIEIDEAGGSNFKTVAVNQMMSVPYALHAATADKSLNNGSNRALSDSVWLLNGNAGTSATLNFLGTTDFEDLVFRANGTERMRIKAQGEIGIGLISPSTNLEIRGDLRAGDGSNYFQLYLIPLNCMTLLTAFPIVITSFFKR